MVTDQQVVLLRQKLMKGKTQQAAAASSAMSERSARKWQRGTLPSERKKARRRWRSRPDPFADVWEIDVVPLLLTDPDGELSATIILEWLDERHPDRFGNAQLRTLQRHERSLLDITSKVRTKGLWMEPLPSGFLIFLCLGLAAIVYLSIDPDKDDEPRV